MKQHRGLSLGLIVLLGCIGLVGCSAEKEELQLSEKKQQQIAERLEPAGEIVLESEVGTASTGTASTGPRPAEEIYNSKCLACHATGAAGAPKVGVVADWESRVAQGMDALYANAINGIRGMPPKGLCMDCSDEEMNATVDYMLANSQ